MQQLTIVGHLGNDAETKDLGNIQVINFSLAVTERIKEENITTWYKCAYFTNNVAILKYLTKGSLIGVVGKPSAEAYIGSDGIARSNVKCIVRDIKLYSSTKDKAEAPRQSQQNSTPAAAQNNAPSEEEHDDLPF